METIDKKVPKMAATTEALDKTLRKACQKVAPVWPLESYVAVNPYLGLSHLTFEAAAQRLAKVDGGAMTMPTAEYLQAVDEGYIQLGELVEALKQAYPQDTPAVSEFLQKMSLQPEEATQEPAIASFTDVASRVMGKDWHQFTIDQVSTWAAAYFDQGQTLWNTTLQGQGLFAAWREEAMVNRTPDLQGLKGFRRALGRLPAEPLEAARFALVELGLPTVGIDLYLHRLLVRVLGWASYTSYLDWQAKLYGQEEGSKMEFLCLLLCFEYALQQSLILQDEVQGQWEQERSKLLHLDVEELESTTLKDRLVLHEAYERAAQRELLGRLSSAEAIENKPLPKVQAVFCIDVRSEVYRRHLESLSPEIETLGFAGFFGFPVEFQPLGHTHGRAQCPVLLPAGPKVREAMPTEAEETSALQRRSLSHQVARAWKSFKLGAISCFSFVGPVGLAYLPKLFTDALGKTRPVALARDEGLPKALRGKQSVRVAPDLAAGIPLEQQIELAQGALTAMSLTHDFAKLVLMVGHGATTVNNPHAAGLDCGACGGNAGEANARVAATVLNRPEVRAALAKRGINIPQDTWFVAAQHDTTTDEVSLFEEELVPTALKKELAELKGWLAKAGKGARVERAPRLGIFGPVEDGVKRKSNDWSEVRPEWGLAGCYALVVAPRERTRKVNLEGRSFLHSYNWRQDKEFKVLELIMTAPMMVTSWINLQYFASTVDPVRYGAGNKTLHNVTGGMGVLEGYGGDLRTGLPWQSVHDGEEYQHQPVRLNVVIEAPTQAMNGVIARHEELRHLLDHGWIHLWAMDEQGQVSQRYVGGLSWSSVD